MFLQAGTDLSVLAAIMDTCWEVRFTSKIFWLHNVNILSPIAEFCHHDDFLFVCFIITEFCLISSAKNYHHVIEMFIGAWRLDWDTTNSTYSSEIIWSPYFLWEAGLWVCHPGSWVKPTKPDPLEDRVSRGQTSTNIPSTVCCVFLEAPKTSRWLFFSIISIWRWIFMV